MVIDPSTVPCLGAPLSSLPLRGRCPDRRAAGPARPPCRQRSVRILAGPSGAGRSSLWANFHTGRCEQVRYAEAESFGNEVQGFHGGIGRAPFEMTHVGPVHADGQAESFLGVSGLRSKGTDDLTEAVEQLG
jgi:hypothetical protein